MLSSYAHEDQDPAKTICILAVLVTYFVIVGCLHQTLRSITQPQSTPKVEPYKNKNLKYNTASNESKKVDRL